MMQLTDFTALAALLRTITRLQFRSMPEPGSQSGWAGHGMGQVQVECEYCADREASLVTILRFHETGEFIQTASPARPLPFRNVYRWSFSARRVSLHHERRGIADAVWLFDLVAGSRPGEFVSEHPHPCGEDAYQARLRRGERGFELEWTITGPVKNERLYYRYESENMHRHRDGL